MAAASDNVEGGKYYSNCEEKTTQKIKDYENLWKKFGEISEVLVEEEREREERSNKKE